MTEAVTSTKPTTATISHMHDRLDECFERGSNEDVD